MNAETMYQISLTGCSHTSDHFQKRHNLPEVSERLYFQLMFIVFSIPGRTAWGTGVKVEHGPYKRM